jgi:DNA-binding CsgD family transcriptional regulator
MTAATARRDNPLVCIDRVRDHIRGLVALDLPPRSIGQAAGVSHETVIAILDGVRRRVHLAVAVALLGVTSRPHPNQDVVLAIGAARRQRALAAIGWPLSERARQLHMTPGNVSRLFTQRRINYQRWADVADQFRRLACVPGPSDAARMDALRKGWPPPAAWPRDRIDDPTAGPLARNAWHGARVDRSAVLQCIAGRLPLYRLSAAERAAAVVQMTSAGHSPEWTARVLGTDAATVLNIHATLGLTEIQKGA